MASNWAIVIGINHYDHHPERQLKYAVSDAQLMCDFLCTHAGFARDRILLCLGDQEYKTSLTYPTYPTLLRLLNRDLHPDRIGQVDRLWFFFGGHGVSQNGRDYLLTSDSLLEDIELKIALPIDEVIASLQRHQAADIVLILDNCRQQQGSRKFVIDDIGKQTIKLAQSRGITTIFSCDYGQFSYELESLKQGAFTHALVEGLKQYTLPDKLEPYLRRRVAELNQRSDQIPRIWVEPAAKALQPLLPSAVTAADIMVLVDRAREAELEENFETAKQSWWQVIEVSQSGDQIREGRMAIDRVSRKTGDRSVSVLATPTHQLTRQRFLKWAIPAGVGVVGVTIVSQFLGHQSQQSSPLPSAPLNFSGTSSTSQSTALPPNLSPSPADVDYSKLEAFLKARQWQNADQETADLVLKVAKRKQQEYLDSNSIKNFPCDVLSKIDRLWVDNSQGKFGFSVQRKVYIEDCGGKPDGQYDDAAWTCFRDAVGWSVNQIWISYYQLTFDISAKAGHLPASVQGYWGGFYAKGLGVDRVGGGELSCRTETCRLQQ